MYLLDTNVLSEFRRPERADPKVTHWAQGQFLDDFYVSTITILELEIGCLRLERRDPKQGRHLRHWIENAVLARYQTRILPFDIAMARECARQHVPDPKPERDAMLAATAVILGLTLVTRNTKDFEGTGVRLINPWL
jgi:toxin FitB